MNPSRESGLPETLSGSAREAAMNKKQSYKNKIFRPLFGLWSQKHGKVRATFSSGCNPCGSCEFLLPYITPKHLYHITHTVHL